MARRRRIVCDIFGWTREEYEAAPRVKCNWALAFNDLEVDAARKRREADG